MPPITKDVTIGGVTYLYSYQPLDKLVLHMISSLPDKDDLLCFDIIIGRDAGQDSSKCYMKFVLWYKNEICEVLKFCAKILCKKELYEILSNAWAGPLNEAINNDWDRKHGDRNRI